MTYQWGVNSPPEFLTVVHLFYIKLQILCLHKIIVFHCYFLFTTEAFNYDLSVLPRLCSEVASK